MYSTVYNNLQFIRSMKINIFGKFHNTLSFSKYFVSLYHVKLSDDFALSEYNYI